MSNIQRWGTYDIAAAEAEAAEVAKASSGSFLKLKNGKTILRVLPPPLGRNSPFVITFQHTIDLPGMQNMLSMNCPRMMAKQPCLVCMEAERLKKTGRPADYDLAGDFFARIRVYCNVIDREQQEAGPMVWAFGKSIHEQLTALRADTDAGGDFTNPTAEGFDISVTRTGTGRKDTKYKVNPCRNNSELGNFDWIDIQADITRFGKSPSMQEMRKLLEENGVIRPSREAPAAAPARRPPTRTAEADVLDVEAEEV